MPKGSLVAPVAGATCLTLLLGFSAKSILQCLHKIALAWIGSAQYGQFFVVSFMIPHSYMFKKLGSSNQIRLAPQYLHFFAAFFMVSAHTGQSRIPELSSVL
jgi:hypothetical protein